MAFTFLFMTFMPPLGAHDIPADVLVQMLVKPEGNRLRVLVRVPLGSMRDVDFPQRGPPGYLDLARVRPLLRGRRDAVARQQPRDLRRPDAARARRRSSPRRCRCRRTGRSGRSSRRSPT